MGNTTKLFLSLNSHSKDAGDGKCQNDLNLTSEAISLPAAGNYEFAIQKLQQQKLQSRKRLDQSHSQHQVSDEIYFNS